MHESFMLHPFLFDRLDTLSPSLFLPSHLTLPHQHSHLLSSATKLYSFGFVDTKAYIALNFRATRMSIGSGSDGGSDTLFWHHRLDFRVCVKIFDMDAIFPKDCQANTCMVVTSRPVTIAEVSSR